MVPSEVRRVSVVVLRIVAPDVPVDGVQGEWRLKIGAYTAKPFGYWRGSVKPAASSAASSFARKYPAGTCFFNWRSPERSGGRFAEP